MKKAAFCMVSLLKQTIMPPVYETTPTMPQPTSDQSHQTQHQPIYSCEKAAYGASNLLIGH